MLILDEQIFGNQMKKTGFVYNADITDDTGTHNQQRILKSNTDGFIEPDKKHTKTNYGLIDWTDNTTQIVWSGSNRYSAPDGTNKIIFRNGIRINFEGFVAGVIAGAAFKNGVFIIFTLASGVLRYYFFASKTLLGSGVIDTYSSLTQAVCVSQDASKACFIANAITETGNYTAVVDLTINLATYTVTIATETLQDIEDHTNYSTVFTTDYHTDTENPTLPYIGYEYTVYNRAETSIIIAVDYKNNTRVDYAVATAVDVNNTVLRHDSVDTGTLFEGTYKIYSVTTNSDIAETATFTFGDDVLTTTKTYSVDAVEYLIQDSPPNYTFDPPYLGTFVWITDVMADADAALAPFRPVPATIPPVNYSFRIIDGLDLRYDFIAYTDCLETDNNDGSYVLHRDYVMKIGAYTSTFMSVLDYERLAGDEVLHASLFNLFFTRIRYADGIIYPLFGTSIRLSVYKIGTIDEIVFDGSAYIASPVYFDALKDISGGNPATLRSIALTDKYGNKLLKLAALKDYSQVSPEPHNCAKYETPIFIKIDNTNTLRTNHITTLKGMI